MMDRWISICTRDLTSSRASFASHRGEPGHHADAIIVRPEPQGVTIMIRIGQTSVMDSGLAAIKGTGERGRRGLIVAGKDAPHVRDPLARAYELDLRARRTAQGVAKALEGLEGAGLDVAVTLRRLSDDAAMGMRRASSVLCAVRACYDGLLELLLHSWTSGARARRLIAQHMEQVAPFDDPDARTTVASDAAKLISGWGQAIMATTGPEHEWPLKMGPKTRAVILPSVMAVERALDELEREEPEESIDDS